MTSKALIKVICLTAIGAPGIVAATQGLVVPPEGLAAMALLALAAGYMLAEIEPGWKAGSKLPDQQVTQIVDALEDRLRKTPVRVTLPGAPRG